MDCASCGRTNRPDARFCDGCGAALVARAPDAAVARKVVTIVFADLIGSTSLHERLDPESVSRVMDRYYQAVRAPVEVHGGTVVSLLGDGVLCAFGVPRVAEDDAIRAVRAAVGIQHAFREFVREQRAVVGDVGLRVAVNTGEVVVSDDYAAGIGDPLNVAARLQQEGRDGDVLLSASTQRLVSELVTLDLFGVLALRGRSETVTAYRVVSLDRPAATPTIPFVGRDAELRRVAAVYESAVARRRARCAMVLGSPGLGKSRLIAELIRRLNDRATVLTVHCDAAGGASFAPLAEPLRALLRVEEGASGEDVRAALEALAPGDDGERARIAAGIAALLAGAPASPEETFFVVRRLLAALAAAQPVVLVIDDLQWAEPLLLDLIEHLVQWSTDVPLFVLGAARPELRDARPALAAPGPTAHDVVTLAGLDAGAATRLAANVIGADALPAAMAGRVLAVSEGNPLFLGELVRMLVHDGVLKREGDRWVAGVELAALEMPPTIQALLAGRIERLRPEERTVLERAAVVGRQFSRAAVAHLLPPALSADLDARLEALRRSELVEPDAGFFLGEPGLRFHHMLIRDAAYRRLLKGTRAELHGRFADWLERRAAAAIEHDETIGWHLEQAHQHLRELGPLDEQGRAFGARAARYLAAAGRRALGRDDVALAASLLGRALDRLERDDPARADLALDWCEALLSMGSVGPAAAAIDELGRFADGSDRLRAWHTCFAGQLTALTDPQALRATAESAALAAEQLAAAGDAAGEAKAYSVQALALARLGKVGASESALDHALAAARRGGDRRRANAVLAGAPLAALWGPSPVTHASGRCLDVVRVLRITQGAPAVEAVALRCQGVLESLRGRSDAARRMIGASRHMVEELGITQRLCEADVYAGLIELIEGDAVAAERCLRTAYEGLREHGLGIDAAQAAALLGRALLAQDRAAEAEALSRESEALAGDDVKAAIAWRGVRAEALARRGEHDAAVDLARAAVDLAAATDGLLDHADARVALAAALRAAGRSADAAAEEARAIELWDAKGATLLAERARGRSGPAPHAAAAVAAPGPDVARRVRANAATANVARVDAAAAARDIGAFFAAFADGSESVHHPTETIATDRDGRRAYEILLSAQDLVFAHEPLATLGESLALCRSRISSQRLDTGDVAAGATHTDSIMLAETDARGLRRRTEFFAVDRLADAVVWLYERYAELLGDDGARERAATTARSLTAVLGPFELDRYAAGIAPDVIFMDHRMVGFPSGRGSSELLRSVGSLLEAADDVATRVDDVLAVRPDALVLRWATFGTARLGHGPFEWQFLRLLVFGADGLLERAEQFDVDRDGDALAAFDESARDARQERFANAAVRLQRQVERLWRERDWDAVATAFNSEASLDDRRALVGTALGGAQFFANMRMLFEAAASRWQSELCATRGERLALFRVRFSGELAGGGQFVDEHLAVIECDERGLRSALVVFDLDAVGAAYAELDRRFAAGEGAPYAELLMRQEAFRRAAAANDREALARLLPPDVSIVSQRRFANIGAPMSRDEYLAGVGVLGELGVDADIRLDHLRISPTAAFGDSRWYGVRDGSAFSIPVVFVYAHDGRAIMDWEFFDADQIEAATARFERLSAPLPGPGMSTAATRAVAQLRDRRREYRVIATRGERLALARACARGETGDATRPAHGSVPAPAEEGRGGGPQQSLLVLEVDDRGDRVAELTFAGDDLDAAYAALDARYSAGEAADQRRAAVTRTFSEAFAARDWEALATVLAPDLVVNDHRLLGWDVLRGPAAYVEALRSLVELSPDVRLRIDHIRMAAPGFLYITTFVGTRDGGAFEAPSAIVCEVDDAGRIRRFDQYGVEQLEQARAHLEAIAVDASRGTGADSAPSVSLADALHVPPNLATRTSDRFQDLAEAGEWDALRALCAPIHIEDRRRLNRITGDCDMTIANAQLLVAAHARVSRTLLAIAGDRLALERMRWQGNDEPSYEVETLQVLEVDADGRITASIIFDVDDRRAASIEMRERAVRSGNTLSMPPAIFELARGIEARDPERMLAALPADYVFHDHRRTGIGRIEGAADYVAAVVALFESSPDVATEDLYQIAVVEPHGVLSLARTYGHFTDGGEFESVFLRLQRHPHGRWLGTDLYELDDFDLARTRLAELVPNG